MLTIFGRDGCQPCKDLKRALSEVRIEFKDVDITQLPEHEQKAVRTEIAKVSRLGIASVPAALLEQGETTRWFSNHGDSNVTELFQQICLAVAEPW